MADAGPPLVLMAFGLILWLAVNATLAGISIQTIGVILFVVGVVWLVIELAQSRGDRYGACAGASPGSFVRSITGRLNVPRLRAFVFDPWRSAILPVTHAVPCSRVWMASGWRS